jgi:transcriptional regulator with XRE-family HTH domain
MSRKMDPQPAGAAVRALRTARGANLEALATASGLSAARIATIERWTLLEPIVDAPDEGEIASLAVALDTTLDAIVSEAWSNGYPGVLLGRRRGGNVELVFLRPNAPVLRDGGMMEPHA